MTDAGFVQAVMAAAMFRQLFSTETSFELQSQQPPLQEGRQASVSLHWTPIAILAKHPSTLRFWTVL